MLKIVILLSIIFLISCAPSLQPEQLFTEISAREILPMQLTSSAFASNGNIPAKYTCDGENTSPPLQITSVPTAAKSLVLIMDDPDIPDMVKKRYTIAVWDHWMVFNIPPTTKNIPEGKNPAGILGKNTGGKNAYAGPCPPDREHRYFFRLFALDAPLPRFDDPPTKQELSSAMEGHILKQAELMGVYQRQ